MDNPQYVRDEDINILKPTGDKPTKSDLRKGGAKTTAPEVAVVLKLDNEPTLLGSVKLPDNKGVKEFEVLVKPKEGGEFRPVTKVGS